MSVAPGERALFDRDPKRLAWRTGLLAGLVLLIFHHGHFLGSDEAGVVLGTRALNEGELAVEPFVHTYKGADGRYYSQYAIGQSVLGLPFLALGNAIETLAPKRLSDLLAGPGLVMLGKPRDFGVAAFTIGLYAPMMTGLLVALLCLFQLDRGVPERHAVAAALAIALGTYVAFHANVFLRHTTETLALLGAFFFYARFAGSGCPRSLLYGSILACAIPLLRLPAAVFGPPLGAFLLYAGLRVRREHPERLTPKLLWRVGAPLLVAAAIHFVVSLAKWGHLFDSPMLDERGKLDQDLVESLTGFLLSPGIGIASYSPLLLLAPFFWLRSWRSGREDARAEALFVFAIFAVSVGFYSAYTGWTGLWSAPGPRYLLSAGVLLLLPLGDWLRDDGLATLRRAAAFGLAAVGAGIQVVLLTTSWIGVGQRMGWHDWEAEHGSKWGFLFQLETSPIAGAWQVFGDLAYHDLWIIRIAQGWPGVRPAPVLAAFLFLAWLAGITALVRSLRSRLAQEAPAEA